MRRPAAAPCLLLVVAAAAPVVPVAAAHCETPGLNSCPLNAPIEAALDAAEEATGRDPVVVLVKNYRFHPEVVHVADGGAVLFVDLDDSNADHFVRSSGSCGSASADLDRCAPRAAGLCFDSLADTGQLMGSHGDAYPLTVRHDAALARVQKSHGVGTGSPLGDLTGAQPYRTCPAGTASLLGAAAVVPYHCGLHGGTATATREMRGAIVIEGAEA